MSNESSLSAASGPMSETANKEKELAAINLQAIDTTKLHMAKSEDLKAYAKLLNVDFDPDNVARQDLAARVKERLIETQRDGLVRKVVFHNVGEGAPSEVVVSLNGVLKAWPRDVVVDVPTNYLRVLDDAVEWRTEIVNGQRVRRKYMTHSYSIVE